ncbi:ketohydroxyglutarate aldolase [Clostridium fungisolvens]|uniref:2-dehydro-3-deoxy-6-phosphogalactonate aldolase n=1 Tax=Clostridium fungisolvens TaxID=1604897 RepID=A0A6V8SKH0_9CLOT|nr:ketohydroxyglutarate aldolase [Clostridium fungisolvens]GFP75638.1 2-dehydro-3-deoxy-6-phosphogalactonate aldolase [Clostridium fungisolvens]
MFRADIVNRIEATGVMAIVRTETIERGIEIAEGCLEGGVDVLEISYTLPNAGEVIKALNESIGDKVLIGAGTVLDGETARLAILAGAKFIIAPNFSKEVAKVTNRYQIPYAPGCSTVTEMVEALEAGASFIKAFPISNFYGPSLVSVIKTPIPQMPILASGGITLDNLAQWISEGVDSVGIGGLLTKGSKLQISENAKKIREIIDNTRKNKVVK